MRKIKCRKCEFQTASNPAMLRHLRGKHELVVKNISEAINTKIAGYVYSKHKEEPKTKRAKKQQTQAPRIQEIVVPVLLRIPLVFGEVTLFQQEDEQ